MKVKFISSLLLAAAVAASSCDSSDDNSSTPAGKQFAVSGTNFISVDGDITLEDGATKGTGSLVGKDSLGALDGEKNFKIKASLEDDAVITVYTYGKNDNTGALAFKLERDGEELKVTATANGSSVDISGQFTAQSAEDLDLTFDVHHGEALPHVLFAAGDSTGDDADVIFNSEDDADMPAKGTGSFFGVKIEGDASITEFKVRDALFEDDEG